jgi:hypothetical protein
MLQIPRFGGWKLDRPGATTRALATVAGGYFGYKIADGLTPTLPFEKLEINFQSGTGMVATGTRNDFLTKVIFRNVVLGTFTARYKFQRDQGGFWADLRDDGSLDMNFMAGGASGLTCIAQPVSMVHWTVKRLAVLVIAGNINRPSGWGHACLVVDGNVYTFENWGANVGKVGPLDFDLGFGEKDASGNYSGGLLDKRTSGWIVKPVREYLQRPDVAERAVVIQELNMSKVNASAVMSYVHAGQMGDKDFFTSLWCSYQVACALSCGVDGGFTAIGNGHFYNTPRAVYDAAKKRGIVSRTYMIWDSNKTPPNERAAWVEDLTTNYPDARPLPPGAGSVLNW